MNRKERRAQTKGGTPAPRLAPEQVAMVLEQAAELFRAGRLAEAERLYRELLRLEPDNGLALNNLGMLAQRAGDYTAAIKLAERAIAIDDAVPDFHNSAANAYEGAGRFDEAIACYGNALALRPDWPGVLSNLGTALMVLRRLDEAEQACGRAVALAPDMAEYRNNLGLVLHEAGKLEPALAQFRQALALRPAYPEAHNNLGNLYRDQGCPAEALAAYERAVALRPDYAYADSNALLVLAYGKLVPGEELAQRARRWYERHGPATPPRRPAATGKRDPDRRLRIGFVSPDFHAHPVAQFMEPVLRAFAQPPLRTRVETVAYADLQVPDGTSTRLQKLVSDWRVITGRDDAAVEAMIRDDRIDILVDLTGHNANNRMGLFARRPAPIQASYLGFPATTGLPTIDYLITDATAMPAEPAEPTIETAWRLPRCLLCIQPPHDAPSVSPAPAAHAPITFGSFNQLSKLSPETIRLWSDVLRAVPDATLRLKASGLADAAEQERLRRAFAAEGVAPQRLTLLGRTDSVAEHLALYGTVDIALDPLPYNGTTTSAEALWMGVPVLTLAGHSMVERMGATILTAVGLPDWIALSPEDYVAKAVAFAGDRPGLAERRAGQREQMRASPLCDAAGLATALEQAFRAMWQRLLAGNAGAAGPGQSRETGL